MPANAVRGVREVKPKIALPGEIEDMLTLTRDFETATLPHSGKREDLRRNSEGVRRGRLFEYAIDSRQVSLN